MKSDLELALDERVVLRSMRGGVGGHSGWFWVAIFFGGMQGCSAVMSLGMGLGDSTSRSWTGTAIALATVIACVALLVQWIRFKRGPAYFATDRSVIARRFLRSPLVIDLRNIAGAARIVVKYTRYGRVISEVTSNRIAVHLRTGGAVRFGPVEDADELVTLMRGIAEGTMHPGALPDADGGLARAESRNDLYFAMSTTTAGVPRGPIFVGPTRVIGFADPLLLPRQWQLLTIVGAETSADAIEVSVLALAQSSEWGRRAVVMEREGASLIADGLRLLLAAGTESVAFELQEKDAERARKYAKAGTGSAYRS